MGGKVGFKFYKMEDNFSFWNVSLLCALEYSVNHSYSYSSFRQGDHIYKKFHWQRVRLICMLLNFDSAMSQWSVYLECLIIVWYLIGLKKDKIL